MSEKRATQYAVYVHTYPGAGIDAQTLQSDKAVIHIDECSIIIRDAATAEKLVDAALKALHILQEVAR